MHWPLIPNSISSIIAVVPFMSLQRCQRPQSQSIKHASSKTRCLTLASVSFNSCASSLYDPFY